jgi:hypothetical protein
MRGCLIAGRSDRLGQPRRHGVEQVVTAEGLDERERLQTRPGRHTYSVRREAVRLTSGGHHCPFGLVM